MDGASVEAAAASGRAAQQVAARGEILRAADLITTGDYAFIDEAAASAIVGASLGTHAIAVSFADNA